MRESRLTADRLRSINYHIIIASWKTNTQATGAPVLSTLCLSYLVSVRQVFWVTSSSFVSLLRTTSWLCNRCLDDDSHTTANIISHVSRLLPENAFSLVYCARISPTANFSGCCGPRREGRDYPTRRSRLQYREKVVFVVQTRWRCQQRQFGRFDEPSAHCGC
jgi:hypothetical protein